MRLMRNALATGALVVLLFSAATTSALAQQVRRAGESTFGGGVPVSVVAGIQQNLPKAAADLKPQQFSFVAKPGSMIRSQLSKTFLNRIVTPFAHPLIKSTSNIKVQTAGSSVFIALDPTQVDPVVLYVLNKGDDLDSIALMFDPRDVGPVEIDLQQPGMPGSAGPQFRFDDSKAAQWEQSAPYTQTLTELMRSIATRKVPPGFSFRVYDATDRMPGCEQAGLRVVPRQVIEGHDMVAFVGVLTNTSSVPVEFQEQTCAVDGVLAVASWPGPLLQPHQSSEVYIVVKRAAMQDSQSVRPSALTVGGMQ